MTPFFDKAGFLAALHALPQPDHDAIAGAQARQHSLTKPAGSLGRLEEIAIFMAGWQARAAPAGPGASGGFCRQSWRGGARGQRLSHRRHRPDGGQFYHGGAAINALARACGADLHVVPLDLDRPTGDITIEAAMSGDECLAALNAGARAVGESDLLIVGEMGIGNTTPAAALCAQAFGGSAREWVGRGTGIDDAAIARKYAAVDGALALHGAACTDPFEALRRLGGREIAAMAGRLSRPVWRTFRSCSTGSSAAPRWPRWWRHGPRSHAIASRPIARQKQGTGGCWRRCSSIRCCIWTCALARAAARRWRFRWCAARWPPTPTWPP
jgi:nicotinate-nucleotide--dimethylbenzimidazole phosphoribosyltransferase